LHTVLPSYKYNSMIQFETFERASQAYDLVDFLLANEWEFYSGKDETKDEILRNIQNDFYFKSGVKSFWILGKDNSKVGFIHISGLGNPGSSDTPVFDIRINADHRGAGIGKEAVKWICSYVFNQYPNKNRLEVNTRSDNMAMRKVLDSSFFAKESHKRKNWEDSEGALHDSVGYAILRADWKDENISKVSWLDTDWKN